jgi:hypothetical protein
MEQGAYFLPTAQPLGTLLVCLLEPESQDGLLTWGFFGDAVEPNAQLPVYRLVQPTKLPLK